MMDPDQLERAWPAAAPPPGFSDRVLERLRRSEAVPAPTSQRMPWWRRPQRMAALGFVALAVVVGVWVARWPSMPGVPGVEGDVLAAEPRSVSIGARAVAELASGAHVRWLGNQVQQEHGQVRYRVEPGAPFQVQTPYGSVAVLGTVFQVSVAGSDDGASTQRSLGTGGAAMNKQGWAIVGTSAALGALLFVNVEQGHVRLSKGDDELLLSAGQSGLIGSDGVPRRGEPVAASAAPSAPPPGRAVEESAPAAAPESRRLSPERRTALRAQLLERLRAAAERPPAAPAPSSGSNPAPPGHEVSHSVAEYSKALSNTVRTDFMPLAQDCYTQLLRTRPGAQGAVVLSIKIIAETSLGGIVDSADVTEASTLRDAEFETCLTESFLSLHFGTMAQNGEATIPDYTFQFEDGQAGVEGELNLRDRTQEKPESAAEP